MADTKLDPVPDYVSLDHNDPLRHFKSEFILPSKADLKTGSLGGNQRDSRNSSQPDPCVYLSGHSLGLQPKRTKDRIAEHLTAWAKKGVHGHFAVHEDSNLDPFVEIDAQAARMIATLVGAQEDEVAIMETLTANLHLMMASFYRPTAERYKIILEGKAFPSDHYAVSSQIVNHNYRLEDALVVIEPEDEHIGTISTSRVLSTIDKHSADTALILLPGVQYYSGQYFDIPTITKHAHSKGIAIGWDLAHAVGNVELQLHEWDVDFAVWCNYKYLNAGPGAVAALFVHRKHGTVEADAREPGKKHYRPRLAGWWGGDKSIRFDMGTTFVPIPGAQGFQVGNPSSLAVSALIASLEVFQQVSLKDLRRKSINLTGYLERRLLDAAEDPVVQSDLPYRIITPSDAAERGAQLSIRLKPGMLTRVLHELEAAGIVVDERRPDVIRVAPTPLYNTFEDVAKFSEVFVAACCKYVSGAGTSSVAGA